MRLVGSRRGGSHTVWQDGWSSGPPGMRALDSTAIGPATRALVDTDEPRWVAACQRIAELVLIAVSCFAPWLFGAREAWALLYLTIGVSACAFLVALTAIGRPTKGVPFSSTAGLALGGLVLLALFQAAPLPERVLGKLDPALASLRAELLPRVPELVAGEEGEGVELPPATLAQDRDATLQTAALVAALWVVFHCVLCLSRGPDPFRRFSVALAVNAAAIALFSMIQLLTTNGKIYWVRPSPWGSAGPFFNHNHLAAYLNLGLASVLGLMVTSDRRGSPARSRSAKLLTGYAAAVLVVGVVVSLSRSGFLAMSALAVVALLTLRPRGFRLGVGVAFVAVVVALLLPAFGGLVAYPERIESILRAESYQARFQIWTAALQSWRSHPFWGSGLGGFGPAVARFRRHDDGVVFLHAENEYVEWLVEGGLVAIVLLGLLSFGVIRAGRRAGRGAQSPGDLALVTGAAFAGLTLVVHSASDFAMHTAAVALPAVMLAAFVVKASSEASPARSPRRGQGRAAALLGAGLLCAISATCVASLVRLERCESTMAEAGLGTYTRYERLSGAEEKPAPLDSVRERDLIGEALSNRPGWAEGYLWLGRVLLRQYEEAAAEAVGNAVTDPKAREKVTTPLWLHRQVHATPPGRREPAEKLAAEAPIGLYLVPALRAFLEARRCCPYIALPHAEIGGLDFLLARGDPAGTYLRRAARLAGARIPLLALTAEFAANTGDLDVAALCWRRMLAAPEADWEAVADRARADLPPDRVLAEVVPDAGFTIRFAERLYPSDGEQGEGVRQLFAREALDRLEEEHQLPRPARLEIEARARRLLGEVDLACTRIAEALALEPRDGARRRTLIQWLLAAGKPAEAHRQAVIGVSLDPTDRGAHDALRATLEASHPTHPRSGVLPP